MMGEERERENEGEKERGGSPLISVDLSEVIQYKMFYCMKTQTKNKQTKKGIFQNSHHQHIVMLSRRG